MLLQVVGRLRYALAGKIVRCADQHKVEGAQRLAFEARVGKVAAADHRVHAFANHIDHAVAEVHVQFDLGVAPGEFAEYWQQHAVANRGQAHAQATAWRIPR